MKDIKYFSAYTAPQIDNTFVGNRIKQLRVENGLKVSDLQSIFGFEAPNAIYNWESGKSIPNICNLIVLRELYELNSIDTILFGEKKCS